MDPINIFRFLMICYLSNVRARTVRLPRSADSSAVEKWVVSIAVGKEIFCTGVQVSDDRILTLADCINNIYNTKAFRVIYTDGTKQKVIAEERSSVGETLSLLKIKVTGETKKIKFARLSDTLSPKSEYDYQLYNMDKTKKVIPGNVDFVSDKVCEKAGIFSIIGKGNKCFKVDVNEETECKTGSPLFGTKKNEIILQGLLVTSSESCISSPQAMISIQPHLAWINTIIIDCGSVPKLKFGKAILDNKGATTLGATASIKCEPGYEAEKEKIVCNEAGDWGKTPKCKKIDCGDVQDIPNGKIILAKKSTSTVGATATVKCDPGFLSKPKKVVCLKTGNWEKSSCELKDCGTSLSVPNGTLSFGTTTVGSLASVTCNDGYFPKKDSIECRTSGKWESPICVIKDCGDVKNIQNGNVTLDEGNSKFGAKATVYCKSGYQATQKRIICLETGKWQKSKCRRKDCGTSLSVQNGNLTFGETKIGSIASVTCNSGYLPKKDFIECLTSGQWETPSCVIKDCGSLDKIMNGTITLENSTSTVGATATVDCNPGYKAIKQKIMCFDTGKWEQAMCMIKDCGSSLSLPKGALTFGQTTVGSLASVTCNSGYLPEKDFIECLTSGSWETPLCIIKDCGSVEKIKNGKISKLNKKSTVGAMATVDCNHGYTANKKKITCLDTGKWEQANCILKDCGSSLKVAKGTISFGQTTVGSLASVTCNSGYFAEKDSIQCLKSGSWETPLCTIKDCGPVEEISNGTITLENLTSTVGSTANVNCKPGYEANKEKIACLKTGKWEQARCIIKDCGSSLNVTNGTITFGTTTVGSLALVTCVSEYLPEKDNIECLISGRWETPICIYQDINECEKKGKNNCDVNAQCTNTVGSYTCQCKEGFKGDGLTCTDINECKNGTDNCDDNARCTNTNGSYICQCNTGFDGDGVNCTEINECSTGSNNCDDDAECTNTVGSFTCKCKTGFIGDGVRCQELDVNGTDCLDLLNKGVTTSGVYPVTLWSTQTLIWVYCDMETDGGGWTLFQKRFDGNLSFNGSFNEFENGFGNVSREFWTGLRFVKEIAEQNQTTLRIHVTDVNDVFYYREYGNFSLTKKSYVLNIGSASGSPLTNQYNTLNYHNGMKFSTYDSDNDKNKKKNCADRGKSGWWFKNCYQVNLNGFYATPGEKTTQNKAILGIIHAGLTSWVPLKTSTMMIRRII